MSSAKEKESLGSDPSQEHVLVEESRDAVFGEITEDGPNYRAVSLCHCFVLS